MKTNSINRGTKSRIFSTILVAAVLACILLLVIGYIYKDAEEDGFHDLHIETKEIKEAIELQMHSDQENLQTMANFAAKLYANGEGYDILFKSFVSIGLIENIGILLPDNSLITKIGISFPAKETVSFENEIKKGEYISGRVRDLTNPEKEVVRSAVPITVDGEKIGILYGVISLETLSERYLAKAVNVNSQLYVIERSNGNLIINTHPDKFANISTLSNRKFQKNFTYDQFKNDIDNGKSGYTSFKSSFTDDVLYIHYSPLEISDWQIMLAEPEKNVFEEAKTAGFNLILLFFIVIVVISLYVLFIFTREQKSSNLNSIASKIRKLLIEINHQSESITEALETIAKFSGSHSVFFVDTDGEEYSYNAPGKNTLILSETNRKYFIAKMLEHSANYISAGSATTVNVLKLFADSELKSNEPDFYNFLTANGIKLISFASIVNKNGHISLLGAVNARKNSGIRTLLAEISICFSIAISNKKYLSKTETIAVTDSLTGLLNRLSYKKKLAEFYESVIKNIACIYIDVNELHFINNKYGHGAGDGMLLYVANTLKDIFAGGDIFRIGGDEFLVFMADTSIAAIEEMIDELMKKTELMDYHISVGMSFSSSCTDVEALVIDAEKRMYEAKAAYYQKKDMSRVTNNAPIAIEHITTGIKEFDTLLTVLGKRYIGIYCVTLSTDFARPILRPAYLKTLTEEDNCFSRIFSHYIHELVDPDYHRTLLNFLEYDIIKRQLMEGHIPSTSYSKINGNKYRLSVYALSDDKNDFEETLWIFENEN